MLGDRLPEGSARSPKLPRDREGRLIHLNDRCRVDGVAHSYLGPAHLPDTGETVHVFARREWLPDTPEQLPMTLVPEEMTSSVSLISRSRF